MRTGAVSRGLDSSLELVFPEDRASSIPGSQALCSALVAVRSVAASADFGHDWSSRTAPQRGRLRLPRGVHKFPMKYRFRGRQQHFCLAGGGDSVLAIMMMLCVEVGVVDVLFALPEVLQRERCAGEQRFPVRCPHCGQACRPPLSEPLTTVHMVSSTRKHSSNIHASSSHNPRSQRRQETESACELPALWL